MVLATQNPIEYEGTFPLPEAQLDRFMLRIRLGYPKRDEEMNILERQLRVHPIETWRRSTTEAELLRVQQAVREIFVDDLIRRYIVDLANATAEPPGRLRRGEPARVALADAAGQASGAAAWARFRPAGRRQGAGDRRCSPTASSCCRRRGSRTSPACRSSTRSPPTSRCRGVASRSNPDSPSLDGITTLRMIVRIRQSCHHGSSSEKRLREAAPAGILVLLLVTVSWRWRAAGR